MAEQLGKYEQKELISSGGFSAVLALLAAAADSSVGFGLIAPAVAHGFLVVILVVVSACYRYVRTQRQKSRAARTRHGGMVWR